MKKQNIDAIPKGYLQNFKLSPYAIKCLASSLAHSEKQWWDIYFY